MPRINEQTKDYPKGYLLSKNATSLPDGAQFVIGQAADGYKGTGLNDPASYVWPTWSNQVQLAYDAGVPIGAQLTMRVAGNDFPFDYENPDADRQLAGFLNAVTGRSVAFIVLRVVSIDSPAMTVKAMNHIGAQLRERTGLRVFLQVAEDSAADPLMSWKRNNDLDVAIGSQYSRWSLLITGDYETENGAAIETPGVWSAGSDTMLIWEEKAGQYRGWPPFASEYKVGTPPIPPVEPPVEPPVVDPPVPPTPGTGQAELIAELKILNAHLDRIFK